MKFFRFEKINCDLKITLEFPTIRLFLLSQKQEIFLEKLLFHTFHLNINIEA